ncbi:MAG TPA: HlyD family efflux transporter periplasmic adaptor subunit, partial [Luteimonas sp.]|nr:HlyD family efflux transporter periplasmic adaptor subunit [Luteimonas sp.]
MKIHACALAMLLSVPLSSCARKDDPKPASTADATAAAAPVARGRVDIEGGPLNLAMPVDALISSVTVREGSVVKRDQVVVSADTTAVRLDEELARARLAQATAQVQLLVPKLAAARLRAGRLEQAARASAGDGQSADDAREAVSETDAELVNAKAGVDLARAELQRTQYQARNHILRAPLDGEVLRVAAWPGMHAAQGTTMVTILPSKARIVRAELSQDVIDQVSVGEPAWILSDDGRQATLGAA